MTHHSFFNRPVSQPEPKPARGRGMWAMFVRGVRRVCTVLGAIMLIWIVFCALVFMNLAGGLGAKAPLPDEMVLVFKMDKGLAEKTGAPTLTDPFPYMQPTLHSVIAQLDDAARDERVKGIIFSLKSGNISLTQVQELRAAIMRFRQAGKFTKFYTSSFADYGQGMTPYYLAAAFDEIWMQPVGMLSITGISAEMPYARAALDKIGARPEFFQREEYKGAMENMTDTQMSAASRETISSIVVDYAEQIVGALAADRNMSVEEVKKHIDTGLFSGDEALAAKLIDRLDYGDVLVDDIDERITGKRESGEPVFVPLDHYHAAKPHSAKNKEKEGVALISAVGMITPSASREGAGAAADDIAGALYEAADDDSIKGVLLRIDSPGGSPSASETIRRAVLKAQEKGKKVVVSMGGVAASGGYWIAAPADYIVASPATLTGSIGVVMGKFSLEQLWERLGVNWQGVSYGENAGLWSLNKPLDAQGAARMNAIIDNVYEQFLTRVAEGREMTMEDARAVAKGRAWTGAQALERGLVDALGGQVDALDRLAVMLDRENRHDLDIRILPREKRPIERLLELMGQQVALGQWFGKLRTQYDLMRGVQGVQAVEPLGLFQ